MKRIVCFALIASLVSTGTAIARSGSGTGGGDSGTGSGAGEGNGRTNITVPISKSFKPAGTTPGAAETELLILITPRLTTPPEPRSNDTRFTR